MNKLSARLWAWHSVCCWISHPQQMPIPSILHKHHFGKRRIGSFVWTQVLLIVEVWREGELIDLDLILALQCILNNFTLAGVFFSNCLQVSVGFGDFCGTAAQSSVGRRVKVKKNLGHKIQHKWPNLPVKYNRTHNAWFFCLLLNSNYSHDVSCWV